MTENLEFVQRAIATLEQDLSWMKRLEALILSGDEEGRLNLLHEVGFQDPVLFPKAGA